MELLILAAFDSIFSCGFSDVLRIVRPGSIGR
jgi:hypothetical protein